MLFFLKGTTLLYAGQEFSCEHTPSLFEREPIRRNTGRDLSPLLRRLAEIKHERFSGDDAFWGAADDEKRIAMLRRGNIAGVFSLDSRSGSVPVDAPDGRYRDLIAGGEIEVKDGTLFCPGKPLIFALN